MLKLMLDENISPALSKPLWEAGVDTITVRDRGLLSAPDHIIWRRAQDEGRSVVTINAGHFEAFARKEPGHGGLVIIPSGHGRLEQMRLIMSVIDSLRVENGLFVELRGRVFRIEADGHLRIEECSGIAAQADPTPGLPESR